MIITIFLNLINWILGAVVKLLPEWSIPDAVFTQAETLYDSMMLFDSLVPIHTAMGIFFMILAFEMTVILYRLAMSLVTIIRGGGEIPV